MFENREVAASGYMTYSTFRQGKYFIKGNTLIGVFEINIVDVLPSQNV